MTSCGKNNGESVFIDTAFDISYFDKDDNDLLNPNNPNSYKGEDIDIYYLTDGEKIKQYEGNLRFPESFHISDEIRDNKYFLVLFPNAYNLDSNNRAITYIIIGNTIEDKVECEFQTYKNNSNIQVTKIWFNDELKWQYTTGGSIRWVEIIR